MKMDTSPRNRTGTSPSSSSPSRLQSFGLLCIGYIIGLTHGTMSTVHLLDADTAFRAPTKDDFLVGRNCCRNDSWNGMEDHEGSESGWKSIHVFYGTREHLVTQPNELEHNSSVLERQGNRTSTTPPHISSSWYSQARQDEIVAALLGGKRNGYFVDLAANDASHWSNTYGKNCYLLFWLMTHGAATGLLRFVLISHVRLLHNSTGTRL